MRELYTRIKAMLAGFPHYRYEHIFIDNSSTDNTVAILRELAAADSHVKVIVNSRDFGQLRSPMHAMYQASGDAVALLASDLQDPPELIAEMILHWERGIPVVVAIKTSSHESRLMFLIRTAYYRLIERLTNIEVFQHFTGFGLYDRKIIDVLKKQFHDPYPYFRGMIAEVGFPHAKVYYTQKLRYRGVTKNNFFTLYDIAMLGITNLSKVPLRVFTFAGFVLSVASLLTALIYLLYKLVFWYSFTVGIAPIVIGVFFFMSIQFIGLGVLGEYIGSIHTMVQNRPLVVERERINFSPVDAPDDKS